MVIKINKETTKKEKKKDQKKKIMEIVEMMEKK